MLTLQSLAAQEGKAILKIQQYSCREMVPFSTIWANDPAPSKRLEDQVPVSRRAKKRCFKVLFDWTYTNNNPWQIYPFPQMPKTSKDGPYAECPVLLPGWVAAPWKL